MFQEGNLCALRVNSSTIRDVEIAIYGGRVAALGLIRVQSVAFGYGKPGTALVAEMLDLLTLLFDLGERLDADLQMECRPILAHLFIARLGLDAVMRHW